MAERTILIYGRVATGIAVDASGDIFIQTPRGGELTLDAAGNRYMVAGDQRNFIKLSRAVGRAVPRQTLLLE